MSDRILIIDDDTDICLLLSRFLTKSGYRTETAHSGNFALQLLEREKFDLVFCDFRLGDFDGKEILGKIKDISPETHVIIITGYSDVRIAVEVIKAGAFDYVTKPLMPDEILLVVKKALSSKDYNNNSDGIQKVKADKSQVKTLKSSSAIIPKYIEGVSDESKELYSQVDLVASTPYSVIIYGESGTGKESIARRIHEKSNRADMPFVAVDCGSLSKELAASELFGHVKGSFTGALYDKTGYFETGNGGTLFLDEVSNLSHEVQVLLLRVIQERKLRRIGSNKETDVDVRIIVASNEKLNESILKGKFREDLYHRFNEFTVHVPPLSERNKDIMLFANHFLKLANVELQKNVTQFSKEVKDIFNSYSWPGNLREMNNLIKRSVLLADGDTIHLHVLPPEIIYPQKFNFLQPVADTKNHAPVVKGDLKSSAMHAEYQVILEVLQRVKYNRSKAAQILNIDRKTLYLKMKTLNMLKEE